MSKEAENIDLFFKKNLKNIEVKFNDAHWQMMQQSIIAATAATIAQNTNAGASLSAKTITIIKTAIISISSVGMIGLAIFYFTKEKEKNITTPAINKESIIEERESLNTMQNSPGKNIPAFYPKTISTEDTSKKSQSNTTPFPLGKDSSAASSQDSTQKKNKKLNVFW